MPISLVQEHIDLIAQQEREFLERRTFAERLGDNVAGFFGSSGCVFAHLLIFAAWVVFNSAPHVHHFDPPPFSFLSTMVALEAIVLAILILMRQTRLGKRADERDHLMLQILLLTEKEMTASLSIIRELGDRVGLQTTVDSWKLDELTAHTPIEQVTQSIRDTLSEPE
jgi:uncharacterized membrane protein